MTVPSGVVRLRVMSRAPTGLRGGSPHRVAPALHAGAIRPFVPFLALRVLVCATVHHDGTATSLSVIGPREGPGQAFGSHSRRGRTRHPAFSSASRTVRTIFWAPGVSP